MVTSIAPVGHAVNQLLLGKVEKLPRSYFVHALSDCCGSEGPAGSAASLVFDRIHSSFGSPIDVAQQVGVVEVADWDVFFLKIVLQPSPV